MESVDDVLTLQCYSHVVGSICNYECTSGYQLSEVKRVTCTETSQWSDIDGLDMPECLSKNLNVLPAKKLQ